MKSDDVRERSHMALMVLISATCMSIDLAGTHAARELGTEDGSSRCNSPSKPPTQGRFVPLGAAIFWVGYPGEVREGLGYFGAETVSSPSHLRVGSNSSFF